MRINRNFILDSQGRQRFYTLPAAVDFPAGADSRESLIKPKCRPSAAEARNDFAADTGGLKAAPFKEQT